MRQSRPRLHATKITFIVAFLMAVFLFNAVPNTHAFNLSEWNGSFSNYWDDKENWSPMYAPIFFTDVAVIGGSFYRPDIYLRYTANGGQWTEVKEFSYQSPYTPQTFHVNDGLGFLIHRVANTTGQPLYFDFTSGEIDLYGSAGDLTYYSATQGGLISVQPPNGDARAAVIHGGCQDHFPSVIYIGGGPITAIEAL